MTQKVMKENLENDIYTWNDIIQSSLAARFEKLIAEDDLFWFKTKDGAFRVVPFEKPFCGFIVEYAEGQSKNALMSAEDVDQYPLADFESTDSLMSQIIIDIGA